MEELNIRDAARLMKISPSTLSRIERGEVMDGRTLGLILIWLLSSSEVR